MSLRDVTIAQMETGQGSAEARGGFGEICKRKLVELRLDTGREGSTFGARRGQTNLRAPGAVPDGELVLILDIILFTNPSAQVGYDTRSIFNRSLTGLNSEFSFS